MTAFAYFPAMLGTAHHWNLLFARQPEPDLEFTEEELEETTATRPMGSMRPGKRPKGKRPLFWMVLLVLIGGIAYVAMEPEMFTEWLNPFLGESTPPPTLQPRAMAPKSSSEPAPAPQAITPPAPMADAPAPPAPAIAPPVAAPSPGVPLVASTSAPMFAEGQKVTVTTDPLTPNGGISLSADSSGTMPGPAVRPGTTLTVLDGELQGSGWMYSVRSDDGAIGWVSEKRLRLKF